MQKTLDVEKIALDLRRNFDRDFLARCNAAQRKEMERELQKPLAADSIQERISGMDAAPDKRGNFGLF